MIENFKFFINRSSTKIIKNFSLNIYIKFKIKNNKYM